MLNSLIKSAAAMAVVIIISMTGGIGNAGQVPTVAPVDAKVPVRVPRLTSDTIVKSVPESEEEAPPEMGYWSISPITLMPKDDSVTFTKSYGGIREANGTFYASVHLPDGVSITALTAYVYEDASLASTIEVYLYRSSHTTASSEVMLHVNSQNMDDSYEFEMITDITIMGGVSPVVDNANYAYFLRATFDNTSPSIYQRLGNIFITYTMP